MSSPPGTDDSDAPADNRPRMSPRLTIIKKHISQVVQEKDVSLDDFVDPPSSKKKRRKFVDPSSSKKKSRKASIKAGVKGHKEKVIHFIYLSAFFEI